MISYFTSVSQNLAKNTFTATVHNKITSEVVYTSPPCPSSKTALIYSEAFVQTGTAPNNSTPVGVAAVNKPPTSSPVAPMRKCCGRK